MRNELFEKAKDLLEEFEKRYYKTLSDVNWMEENESSTDGDYCKDCVQQAKNEKRKYYLLQQRKLPLEKRDKEFSVFSTTYNYGGGYEDSDFSSCEICGKSLDVVVLPSDENIQYVLNDLRESEKIDDYLGYKIYWLIYNDWGEDDQRHKSEHKLTIQLANEVIKHFENGKN